MLRCSDYAVGSRIDRRSHGSSKIQAFMESGASAEWIDAPAEAGRIVGDTHRISARQHIFLQLLLQQGSFKLAHLVASMVDLGHKFCNLGLQLLFSDRLRIDL